MKHAIGLLAITGILILAIFISRGYLENAPLRKAATAESHGEYSGAATLYSQAISKIIPGKNLPDVNTSKVIAPALWKKSMADYAAWLSGPSTGKINLEKRRQTLDGLLRCTAKLPAENLLLDSMVVPLTLEQFRQLWLTNFFAVSVEPDSSHLPLISTVFGQQLSLIKLCALTSYSYNVSLIDTTLNRRTEFSVFPESCTFILAAPGTYLLSVKSSITYPEGKIWRSNQLVVPLTIPVAPSLLNLQLRTRVSRNQ